MASVNNEISILFFSISCVSLLFIAVVLTWIGLWVIAAYSWVIFIIAAVTSWEAVARAMGGFGALFMITFGISMILQIQGHVDLNDFSLGFRRRSSHAESQNIVVNATTAYISKDVISGTGNHTMHDLEIEKAYSEIDKLQII